MADLTQQDLQKLKAEIEKTEQLLQNIQKESAEAQKRLALLNILIRNATANDSTPTVAANPNGKKQTFPSSADIVKYRPYLLSDGSIKYKTNTRTLTIPPKVVEMALEAKTLKSFFEVFSLEIRDNRSKGGALWLKGTVDFLRPYIDIAGKKFGCVGTFTSNGYATGYNEGWFTKCKR